MLSAKNWLLFVTKSMSFRALRSKAWESVCLVGATSGRPRAGNTPGWPLLPLRGNSPPARPYMIILTAQVNDHLPEQKRYRAG